MSKTAQTISKWEIIRIVAIVILSAVFLFSAYKLYEIWKDNQAADAVQAELLQYKPVTADVQAPTNAADPSTAPGETNEEPSEQESQENDSILKLQETYPDVRGWLTVDGTTIDYCFAQGIDNEEYLRHTLDREYLVSGTVFLDYRCNADFTSLNSILYGHKMNNGTMFSDLAKFDDSTFFADNTTGTLYLPHETCQFEILAYLVVPGSDSTIYNPNALQTDFLSYVRANARQFRETELEDTDTFLTLSTCNYEYDGARSVIVAKILRDPMCP